jgi:hypothetical protein
MLSQMSLPCPKSTKIKLRSKKGDCTHHTKKPVMVELEAKSDETMQVYNLH